MAKVKLGFSGLTVIEQVERGRNIKTKLTGNVNYATPNPTLIVWGDAIDALELAYNESRNRDKVKAELMRLRRKEFLALVIQMGAYVQEASEGDEEKILTSGFDVRGPNGSRPVVAGEVREVRVSKGSNEGKGLVRFKKADNAVIYLIEVSLDFPNSIFELKGFTTKLFKEIDGFVPGTKYLVRVTALGREEAGPHSNPAQYMGQ